MKKLFFFLFGSLLLCSCNCALSQIPPQFVYADANCSSALLDYRTYVTVTGGCFGFTLTQNPAPGTILNAANKSYNVDITATGVNLKTSNIHFLVTLIDTVTPKITPIGVLAEAKLKQINDLYDVGDRLVKSMFDVFDANFPYDSTHVASIDSSFYKKLLVVASMDSLGYRKRFISYADSVDLVNNLK
jgi:hypothetical protein